MELISIWYLTPFAGGAMLVRMLINVETALVWMVYSALLLLFQMEDQSLSVVYFLLSGLIALTALGVQKERLHLLRVGLQVGFVNSAVAILI